jgi:hypothetical protein
MPRPPLPQTAENSRRAVIHNPVEKSAFRAGFIPYILLNLENEFAGVMGADSGAGGICS